MINMKGRSIASLYDLAREEIDEILKTSKLLKLQLLRGQEHPILKGKTLAMIFEKPSTRTRVSFEVGMWQLGGYALYLSASDLQLGRGENIGRLSVLRLAYVGDGNNVAHSLLYGCTKMGMNITIACPKGYEPDSEVVSQAKREAKRDGSDVKVTNDPNEAVKKADIIYTDVWTSMG